MTFLVKTGEKRYRAVYPLIVNEKDGTTLVKIPGGEFEMGDGKDEDCPKRIVNVENYYIGVYCITNRQYKKFVEDTGYRAPEDSKFGNPIWKDGDFPEEFADHPVVCVNWHDAVEYCKWANVDLPTEAQWEKVARGVRGHVYPWGNAWDERKCRNATNRGDETTCPVYGYPKGISSYGCYNMSGNVWEWCKDLSSDEGSARVLRGGSWRSVFSFRLRGAYRDRSDPSSRKDSYGFRVVLSPQSTP